MFINSKFQKPFFIVIVLIFLLSNAGCTRFAAPQGKLPYSLYAPPGTMLAKGEYTIGVRDQLEIAVWRCPELNRAVEVRAEDGKITMPLIGDIEAKNLTPKELANIISKKLAHYIKEPRVAVGVKKFGTKTVYLMGMVRGPGSVILPREGRILDAIGRAGGLTDNAVPSTTYIVRGGYYDSRIIRVNLGRLIHGGDMTQNVYLLEGDLVYVPISEIEEYNWAIRKILPSFYFARQLGTFREEIIDGHFDFGQLLKLKFLK